MSHTVLVVEDDVELRQMMCRALELSGYAVVAAQNGRDALDKVSGIDSLCLVILDLVMPEMNGWDFVEQLRKRSEFAAVPIIVHTSTPGAAPATAARVLRKPVRSRDCLPRCDSIAPSSSQSSTRGGADRRECECSRHLTRPLVFVISRPPGQVGSPAPVSLKQFDAPSRVSEEVLSESLRVAPPDGIAYLVRPGSTTSTF